VDSTFDPKKNAAKRGAVITEAGKTRITIYLDDVVIERFKDLSERTGKGYQTLINEALRSHLDVAEQSLTAEEVRKIVREELAHHEPVAGRTGRSSA
jgi:predicted DNA-binding protein